TAVLAEMGLVPIDWVTASKFAELTGIDEHKLPHRKRNWTEDVVWTKQDGNVYYSLRGYNQWLSEQAHKRYQRACGLEITACKSTLTTEKTPTASPYRTQRLRRVSVQPLKLEVS
ncbi:hypothetical protein, partial [Moraxella cuniculi]|uniref:hypothetical protein n=1 Tax=Moraxella cuniculi TaxID=34061 RepID=UPI001D0D67B4